MTTDCVNDLGSRPRPRARLSASRPEQQAMWASGDFAVIGTTLQIVGELLCEAVDVGGGERVLDVAAGNGNATLAAARRFARVTSTDYVPGAARTADGAAPRRKDSTSRSRSRTPKRCPIRPRASTSSSRPSASCSRPITRSRPASCCACAGSAAASAWPPGRRKASSASCSASSPSTCRRRRACSRRCCGAPRDHLQELFAGAASIDAHRSRASTFRYRVGRALRRGLPHVLRPGPTRRSRRSTPNGQAALEADLLALLREAPTVAARRPRRARRSIWRRSSRGEDSATDVRPRPPRR